MEKCDEGQHWPDSLAAVPDAELEEFLAHAETCPYHGEALRREEEPFREASRLARALNDYGDLATTPAARNYLDDQFRRNERWGKTCQPVHKVSLALRYRGEEVARSDYFYDLDARIVREFGEPGDLQVWKLPDECSPEEIFLGVYPIEGFAHAGNEKIIPLPTGQKAVLSVKHLMGAKFAIKFVVAESKALDEVEDNTAVWDEPFNDKARGHSALGWSGGLTGVPPPNDLGQIMTYRGPTFLACCIVVGLACTFMGSEAPSSSAMAISATHAPTAITDIVSPPPLPSPSATQVNLHLKENPAAVSQNTTRTSKGEGEIKLQIDEPMSMAHSIIKPGRIKRVLLRVLALNASLGKTAEADVHSPQKKSASAWYYLPAGASSQALWVRAGEDAALRDDFLNALGNLCDQPSLDESSQGKGAYKIVQLQFRWKDGIGTAKLQVSDKEGKPVTELSCQSRASSLVSARERAVQGIALDLINFIQVKTSGDDAVPSQVDTAGSRNQLDDEARSAPTPSTTPSAEVKSIKVD